MADFRGGGGGETSLPPPLNPPLENRPAITYTQMYAHLNQVDWVRNLYSKKVWKSMRTLSQSVRKWRKIYLSHAGA